ncbi:MAG: hypothetical protein JRD89_02010 [Deltaproteobacteria bacterium]|nr:hypothetical protein [Deltaproteobacteria bacterium]
MGKPITNEQKQAFREFCREQQDEEQHGYFCLCHFDEFDRTLDDGEPLWEFHAANHQPDDTHDILELFGSVDDEFVIEQHGYDEFYAVPV